MSLFGKKIEDKKDKKTAKKPAGKTDAGASMKDLYGDDKKPVENKDGVKKEVKTGNAYKVLVKPLVTEKASVLGAENKYFFAVALKANKIEIAKAIREVYGVKPEKVNIINMGGKEVRFGRTLGKRKDWKKAIITLPEGKTIKVYEGV